MTQRRTRWTMQVQSRRVFLERSMMAAAWAGIAACSPSRQDGRQTQDGGTRHQDAGVSSPDGGESSDGGTSQPGRGVPLNGPDAITAYGPITPNEQFYVTSCCANPMLDATTWSLSLLNRGVEFASGGW
jgi:hypothetical protein